MTEDEAKTKACCGPFAGRLPYGDKNMSDEIAIQGLDPDYASEMAARWPCIGSACMAWRWDVDRFEAEQEAYEDSKNIGGINTRQEPVLGGHCGLAGRPA